MDAILVWFRRDLRDSDHAALCEALRRGRRVFCAFVFDREILDALDHEADRRVEFIRESLVELDAALRPTRHYYLGDAAAIEAAAQAVANQGKQ